MVAEREQRELRRFLVIVHSERVAHTDTHRYTLSLIDEAPSRPLLAAFTPRL